MLKKIISNPFFVFPFLTCIFFWPLSLKLFTFKNDALTYYYPVRTLIGDALNNFELPLWTPFINMGYPLHADMQSGAWNPVIWIIGFSTNYSLAAFHYEMLFYLAMGGIGFYYLGRELGWNKYTAIVIGSAYEFSGPVIDSMQFTTCISSVCYIPFIFLFFRRLLYYKQPAANALLTALFLYLLFTGGYPALFIITAYLLAAIVLFAFFSSTQKSAFAKKLILPLGLVSGAFILLSLPAIISFVNHLQFIDRGKKQGLDFVLENPMPPACMLSLLSPFSTTATTSFFNTNILMRNIYIGIIPLVFLLYAVCNKALRNNNELKFFFFTALVLFGMAWGGYFFLRQLAYYSLPLMDTFRHPALFRFFGVIFFLLIAGFAIDSWNKKPYSSGLLRKIILTLGMIIFLTGALIILFPGARLIPAHINLTEVKFLIASLDFQQRFLLQLPFIAGILCLFYFIVQKRNGTLYILLLSVADLFFATQLNMPITVIGARSFASTERHINRNRDRFPLPGNTTIEQNVSHSLDSSNTIGSILPFQKKIGRNDYFITPGNLSLQERFYESYIREAVFKNRVLYFADTIPGAGSTLHKKELNSSSIARPDNRTDGAIIPGAVISKEGTDFNLDSIAIKKLSANTLICTTVTTTSRLLVFLQNSYPGWEVFIDGNETPVSTVNISFMGVNIPAGKHTVKFSYHPKGIIYAWYISLIALLFLGLFLLRDIFRSAILSK